MERKFWNWVRDSDTGERTLSLCGVIAEESWFGDEVTPEEFRDELYDGEGNITVLINSMGGDCFAAARIYNMLAEYPGRVTVRIDGLAASAASVIAMAGDEVWMSPVSMLMIHNPATIAAGDHQEMEKAIDMLAEVKESIINAYQSKTGISRVRLSNLMDAETWMNANKAVELGFADRVLVREDGEKAELPEAQLFSRCEVSNRLVNKLVKACAGDARKNELVSPEPRAEPKGRTAVPVSVDVPGLKEDGRAAVKDTVDEQEPEAGVRADRMTAAEEQEVLDEEGPKGRDVGTLMERLNIIRNHI